MRIYIRPHVLRSRSFVAFKGGKRWTSTVTNAYDGLKCGVEIHLQLDTKTKLFSNSKTSFQATPNDHVSYFDLAVPGSQPILNKHAVLLALKAATALNCKIHRRSMFDRKHYFYADQPAGYQITQYYHAIATDGVLWLQPRDGISLENNLGVRISQLQIEQDTGKTVHEIDSDKTYIDFNRTNHPLIEIVSAPDMKTPQEAAAFVHKLQTLMKHLGVSTCEFQSGAIRVDVNVSTNGGKRCEIKNLASINDIVHAIRAEYVRQLNEVSEGSAIESVTLGWDGHNISVQREKEGSLEYRYIPDPELPSLLLSEDLIRKTLENQPKLPDELMDELTTAPHGLNLANAQTILSYGLVDYYFASYKILENVGISGRLAANWIVNDILGILPAGGEQLLPSVVTPSRLTELIISQKQGKITKMIAMNVIKFFIENQADLRPASEVIEHYQLSAVEDDNILEDICSDILEEHSDLVEQVVSGKKPSVIKFFVGMVMKNGKGRFNPQDSEAIIRRILVARHPEYANNPKC
ncbi:GatB/GatE catalytic domain-containing protein [Lipomyces tetrasporus]